MEVFLSDRQLEELLGELCVELGFCLNPQAYDEIIRSTPTEISEFVDRIFVLEGLNPDLADSSVRRRMKGMVAAACRKHDTGAT